MLALALACRREPAEPAVRLSATVMRAAPDTIRFSTDAIARRCAGQANAVVLEGASVTGSGMLVLLRHDSIRSDTYPVALLGDSVTVPAAQVATRYVVGDVAHGFALDSGAVVLERDGASLAARVAGRGLDGTARITLQAEFSGVALGTDTASCQFQ